MKGFIHTSATQIYCDFLQYKWIAVAGKQIL